MISYGICLKKAVISTTTLHTRQAHKGLTTMSSEKIRGVIIRENFSGESDKFLTIFAKDKGKISVFAKGARNTKSKFLASSALFTYGDYIIRTASKTPTLITADVINNFYNIRNSLDRVAFASFFTEFTDKMFIDNVADNNALLLLIKSLQRLSKGAPSPRLTACIFQLRLLDILGYRPDEKALLNLSPTLRYAVPYILDLPLNKVFNITLNDDYLPELENFIEKYIRFHINVKLNSYKIIKKLVLTN